MDSTFHPDRFTATIRGHPTTLVNLVVEKTGLTPRAEIVVMAHRDGTGADGGLNNNASGTAALIELARSYAPTAAAQRVSLPYSLVFLSTDGAGDGVRGAAHFAAQPGARQNILGVINLDSIAGRGRPRLILNGEHCPVAGAGARRDPPGHARAGSGRRSC